MPEIPAHIEQMPSMLTPEFVAEKLNTSTRTIRRECERGMIEGARKIGRQWRIPVAYLESSQPA